ncbi:hydroxyacid dehydrogenase [Pseudomonas sp. Mn2068]|uniref:hydroxyacid dehydrogenase n=1 Tax=Pseudomonas sp. Mn2068 TaxID=3395265 RepID=UPI003BD154FE
MSSSPSKIVSRLDLWINPIFDELIRATPALRLQCLARADEDGVWAGLARSAAYHVSAAKDELPRQWFADAALIEHCPDLLCVSSGGAGYDTVDVDACTRAGIAVVNQAGANANSVAEHTFGLILALAKRIIPANRRLRTDSGFAREELMGEEIHGATLGIIGLGVIGERTARVARGFGMQVLAYDPHLDEDTLRQRGAQPATLEQLLAASDYVSLHCPLNASTRHLMGERQFAAMKPGAVFISTARGGIHDEAALYEALKDRHLSGAGLDVWAVEPPPHGAPLLALENVIATYHTAGVSVGGRRNVARSSAQQIQALLRGERPPHLLNPQVWEHFLERLRKTA